MTSLEPRPETPGVDTAVVASQDVTPGSPGTLMTLPEPGPSSVAVAHVADYYRRYPGETVTFFTRVEVLQPVSGFTLRIGMPEELVPGAYRASPNHGEGLPELVLVEGGRFVTWTLDRALLAGEAYEYQLEAKVAPTEHNLLLESRAAVTYRPGDGNTTAASESVEIAVAAKGRYLKYLPALYQEDELMGRFVMLFESFWRPIESQIESVSYYFDPRMTPSSLLPWLASWMDLALDDRWPEERRRLLLLSAASLYRKRGTKEGLKDYLEIYTGEKAQIIEHSAHNLRLGQAARLGSNIALGRQNMPHTFTVILRLPPASTSEDESERARKEQERQQTVESIIKSEKPAHTAYTLRIEPIA